MRWGAFYVIITARSEKSGPNPAKSTARGLNFFAGKEEKGERTGYLRAILPGITANNGRVNHGEIWANRQKMGQKAERNASKTA